MQLTFSVFFTLKIYSRSHAVAALFALSILDPASESPELQSSNIARYAFPNPVDADYCHLQLALGHFCGCGVAIVMCSGMSYTEFSYQLLQAYDFLHLWKHHNVCFFVLERNLYFVLV